MWEIVVCSFDRPQNPTFHQRWQCAHHGCEKSIHILNKMWFSLCRSEGQTPSIHIIVIDQNNGIVESKKEKPHFEGAWIKSKYPEATSYHLQHLNDYLVGTKHGDVWHRIFSFQCSVHVNKCSLWLRSPENFAFERIMRLSSSISWSNIWSTHISSRLFLLKNIHMNHRNAMVVV